MIKRSAYMLVHEFAGSPSLPVASYVEQEPSCGDLVRSGLIDEILASDFVLIEDAGSAILGLLSSVAKRFDLVYVTTATCSWSLEDCVRLNEGTAWFVKPGGVARFFMGKGCNTLCDAVILADEQIRSGQVDSAIIVNVEVCEAGFQRLQPYAFFSDVCVAVELSSEPGCQEIIATRNGCTIYPSNQFSSRSQLSNDPPVECVGEDLGVYLLNTFEFVTRFKYGASSLYRQQRRPDFRVHHFGSDPFMAGGRAKPRGLSMIHIESPPGHLGQIVVRNRSIGTPA